MKDDLRLGVTTQGFLEPQHEVNLAGSEQRVTATRQTPEMGILGHLEAVLRIIKEHWRLASVVLAVISVISGSVVYHLAVIGEDRTARIRIEEKLKEVERTCMYEVKLLQRGHDSDLSEIRRETEALGRRVEQRDLRLVKEFCRAIEGNYQWDRDSRSAECWRKGEFQISIEMP